MKMYKTNVYNLIGDGFMSGDCGGA